jgi:hypothetical protein
MPERPSTLFLTAGFLSGLTVLYMAWGYSGDLLPSQPPETAETYDKVAFYLELGIWVATIAGGLILAVRAWHWRSAGRR